MGTQRRRRQRGISLIEALVALGVMAFGILGITGIQASLRTSSDIAKQRSEAVRLAQQMMEERRNYQVIAVDGVNASYAQIVSAAQADFTGTNATYSRSVAVTERVDIRTKDITVTVQWTDRLGDTQRVVLTSSISGTPPELAASLALPPPGGQTRLGRDRHRAIPPGAVDQQNGTSNFSPPGGDGAYWVFSNTTGLITRICSSSDDCTDTRALFLGGFVRFSTGMTQPTSADAEAPANDPEPDVGVRVNQDSPYNDNFDCYVDATSVPRTVAYYCAVPITDEQQNWSGRSRVTGLDLASGDNDDDDDEFRVCRYTRDLAHTAVGDGSPAMTNEDHPRDYVGVTTPLFNQNFLVIRAGNGSDPFTCPDDNTATPFVFGRTYKHQPG